MSHLTPKQRVTVTKLMGIRLFVNEIVFEANAWWDTGAQVSIISEDWLKKNLPDEIIKPIEDLMDEELELKAANGTTVAYEEWVELTFMLNNSDVDIVLNVPFLVTREAIDIPRLVIM